MAALFRQFSFPGGIPSHAAPETPGSINEGGELGYSLVHAYGAAFDNPHLIVACVIGDGESETGPLAGSWHANKFLNPAQDGAVLPILHLNGYKIANPAVPARIPHAELESLLRGYGYAVYTVEGDDPKLVHAQLAATMDAVIDEIHAIQRRARADGDLSRQRWPVIVLKTPKGWTGPKVRGRAAGGGDLAGPPGPASPGPRPTSSTWRSSRPGCGPTGRRSCSTPPATLIPELGAARPGGLPADERQPAR